MAVKHEITAAEVSEFIYHEAHLLDARDYDAWYELFADDGFYWVPLSPEQTDPHLHVSLAYEDRLLLKLRIERLSNPRSYSQRPKSRSLHVLQRPVIERFAGNRPGQSHPAHPAHPNHSIHQAHKHAMGEADELKTRTNYIYTETRGDEQQMFACTAHHTLCVRDGALRIRLKRVNLLNGDAALGSIQLFI